MKDSVLLMMLAFTAFTISGLVGTAMHILILFDAQMSKSVSRKR